MNVKEGNKRKTEKKVTVIVPTYNAEGFIERCIDKVLEQTYDNIEIIVVDDGSSDGTIALLDDYGDKVKVLQNNKNQGPAYSRNKGLYECQGSYVSFLDADDYWNKEFVATTVAFLEEHPEAVAVSTAYVGIDLKGNSVQKPNLNSEDISFYQTSGSICPNFFDFWSHYFGVLTGTVMMRTEKAKLTGGQRHDLRLTEDLEFWGYLSTFGKWGFIPQPLFTTDPGVLIPSERLKKMKGRYDFFANLQINEWSKRIESKIGGEQSQAYEKIVNHIKSTIVIANAYTLRFKASYRLAGIWLNDLESGLSGILRIGYRLGKFTWPIVCLSLRIREFLKSYISHMLRTTKPPFSSKSERQ